MNNKPNKFIVLMANTDGGDMSWASAHADLDEAIEHLDDLMSQPPYNVGFTGWIQKVKYVRETPSETP